MTMRNLFGICSLVVLTVLPMNAGEPLKLAVTPAQSFAPATVRVRARIEPNATNRSLTIVADGSDFYRSSQFQLDGDRAPKTLDVEYRNVPGGEYDVYAYLTDDLGKRRAIARTSARVLSIADRDQQPRAPAASDLNQRESRTSAHKQHSYRFAYHR